MDMILQVQINNCLVAEFKKNRFEGTRPIQWGKRDLTGLTFKWLEFMRKLMLDRI